MISLRTTLDDVGRDNSQILAALVRKLGNIEPVMDAIGADLEAAAERAFDSERAPDGEAWKQSERARKTGGRTLRDKSILYNSITHSADRSSVAVGSNVIYAAVMALGADQGELGTTRRGRPIPFGDIPGRQYLGIDDVAREDIKHTLLHFLKGGN